jgi:hypothetical protein
MGGPVRIAAHTIVAALGAAVIVLTFAAALRTVVLPRAVPSKLTRAVFLSMRRLYLLRIGKAPTYERRDAVMASYGPVALFVLLLTWLVLEWLAFGLLTWGVSSLSMWQALVHSGSALFTLGFAFPATWPVTLVSFSEAAVGLVLLALLITYLPSLYGAFSRREAMVTKLEVRAGSPPTGQEMLVRAWVLERFDMLNDVWTSWEDWFVDVEEAHSSFPALSFFRSPQPDHSWVTASGAVLDAASIYASTIDMPRDIDAELCIRAGYLALRRISAFYSLPYSADPSADDPITVTRDEYDEVVGRLEAAGVPLRADRDQAWHDFAGWRVNYDAVLVQLSSLTLAPYAPWSSDRTLPVQHRIPLFRPRAGLSRSR